MLRRALARWRSVARGLELDLGRHAEDLVRRELERRGWRCLGQRVRTLHGELDLVCERSGSWACVEVKAGRWLGPSAPYRPADHFSRRQAERQARAARAIARQLARADPERWLAEALFDDRRQLQHLIWTRLDSLGARAPRGPLPRKKRPRTAPASEDGASTPVSSPSDGVGPAPTYNLLAGPQAEGGSAPSP